MRYSLTLDTLCSVCQPITSAITVECKEAIQSDDRNCRTMITRYALFCTLLCQNWQERSLLNSNTLILWLWEAFIEEILFLCLCKQNTVWEKYIFQVRCHLSTASGPCSPSDKWITSLPWYVCRHRCLCMCVYVCTRRTCMSACVSAHIFVLVCMCANVCVYVCVCVLVPGGVLSVLEIVRTARQVVRRPASHWSITNWQISLTKPSNTHIKNTHIHTHPEETQWNSTRVADSWKEPDWNVLGFLLPVVLKCSVCILHRSPLFLGVRLTESERSAY